MLNNTKIQEALIKIRTRPLRFVYLVSSTTDIANAILLYTHLWGGFHNPIFPVYEDGVSPEYLLDSLNTINPDYILLPLEKLPNHIKHILDKLPYRCLNLSSKTIQNINIFIEIYYQYSSFNIYPCQVYYTDSVEMRRQVSSVDKSIHFSPKIPPGLDNTSCLFGYDIEIAQPLGNSFQVPLTQSSAILLSNSTEHIKYSENITRRRSARGIPELKTQPVRASFQGVTGLATGEKECCMYVPDANNIVSAWLQNLGFILQPNDHTRYAEGFIKRCGGLDLVKNLIYTSGTKIFIALGSERAKKSGFKHSEIIGFLKNNFNLDTQSAKQLVNNNLPHLLETKQIFRGYSLKCPNCGLKDWYGIDKVNEFIECNGCAEEFQLESLKSLEFSFKPNELALRFLNGDGHAILSAITFLSPLASHENMQIGGNILEPGKKNVLAEIDLFIIKHNLLVLVECKSYRYINEDKLKEIVTHLQKLVKTANIVDAGIVLLAISTVSIDCDIYSKVNAVSQSALEQGVGVHLLINETFYKFAKQEEQITNLWEVSINSLIVENELEADNLSLSVGEPLVQYGWNREYQSINRNLANKWIAQFIPELNQ